MHEAYGIQKQIIKYNFFMSASCVSGLCVTTCLKGSMVIDCVYLEVLAFSPL